MGLNVNSVYSANHNKPAIDSDALARVTQKIFNPENDKTIDVSKLDLSKFNRASIGTDLYKCSIFEFSSRSKFIYLKRK